MRNVTVSVEEESVTAGSVPSSRRHVAFPQECSINKRCVCPRLHLLIVFIALSIPQATLIPQIPSNAAKL